jgi:predicted methyltransferase
MRTHAEATQRNRAPILEVLRRHVKAGDHVLEVASGSGQHAVYLAPRLGVRWQPTDPSAAAIASIEAWRASDQRDPQGAALDDERCSEVLPALRLDVRGAWPEVRADVLVCVNMIHISPWEAAVALLDGAARLRPRVLYLYGPYRRGGAHTAPSNAAFDDWLKARDPAYGVRDLEVVVAEAETRGFRLVEVVDMPANNLSVVFGR